MKRKVKILITVVILLLIIIIVCLLLYLQFSNKEMGDSKNDFTLISSTESSDSPPYPNREIYIAVRNRALEGMSKEDIISVNNFIADIYLPLEEQLSNSSLKNAILDPDNMIWNIFDETGEIVIGYAFDTEIWNNREKYDCTDEEFQEKYGEPIYYDNKFDSHGMITELKKMQDKIIDSSLKSDFENLIQLVWKMSDTHDEQYVYDTFEILHDMYYYLFNYGPELAITTGERSQSLTYYESLNIFDDK